MNQSGHGMSLVLLNMSDSLTCLRHMSVQVIVINLWSSRWWQLTHFREDEPILTIIFFHMG